MAYTETAVLHDAAYTPTAPAAVYGTRSRPVDGGATTRITVFQHEDTNPVPAGGAGEIERWELAVSTQQARKMEIRRQAENAMQSLADIRDAPSFTNTEAQNAIRYLAQTVRGLVRLSVGLYDATD